VTIRDIWTKFCTEHKYHTINTPEWPNSHKLKIQDGGGRHLELRKNINNFGLDKDILHQIIREDAPWPCGDDHVTKSRNRKLIRVTSSNESISRLNQYQYPDWAKLASTAIIPVTILHRYLQKKLNKAMMWPIKGHLGLQLLRMKNKTIRNRESPQPANGIFIPKDHVLTIWEGLSLHF